MKSKELFKLQALKFKHQLMGDQQDLPEGSPQWMADVDPGADSTRNICALISIPLFEEIERLSNVLSMSKRRLVELALRDLAVSANESIESVGLTNVTCNVIGSVPVEEA
ncbi:MAG TPA: hypothetical protein PLG04_07305 [Anaerolineaceae bacterium]|nr:hypothetical protein [Anaerolineaceae bacterium]HPL26327.1 hypothetical protein [Myxococcota bacterium]